MRAHPIVLRLRLPTPGFRVDFSVCKTLKRAQKMDKPCAPSVQNTAVPLAGWLAACRCANVPTKFRKINCLQILECWTTTHTLGCTREFRICVGVGVRSAQTTRRGGGHCSAHRPLIYGRRAIPYSRRICAPLHTAHANITFI